MNAQFQNRDNADLLGSAVMSGTTMESGPRHARGHASQAAGSMVVRKLVWMDRGGSRPSRSGLRP